MSSMEPKTFFVLLLTLVLIGTMASLITNTPMPGDQTQITNAVNSTFNGTAIGEISTCESGVPFWCALVGGIDGIAKAALAFVGWIIGGIAFIVAVFSFFSGVGAFIGGTGLLPAPLNFIAGLLILFLWLFLALDLGSRIIGVIWGR